MTTIEGHADAAYAPLADQFARNFSERGERGASFAVLVDGELVVDLWGGSSDVRTNAPWQRDTLSVIFSCTKGLMTICALNLVAEGKLDLDAPVTAYWPEFGQSGKDGILVKWLLQHRAGLISFDRDLTVEDVVAWEPVIRAIEEQKPLWTPNAGYRYHTLTHGWLVGELIRRITGQTPGSYLRALTESVAHDTWLGLPSSEQHRVARLAWEDEENGPFPDLDPATASEERLWEERAGTLGGAFPNSLVFGDRGFNDPRIQAAEAPGAGGISNARDLASIWSATVAPTGGLRLLTRELTSFGPSIFGNDVAPYNAWGTGFQVSSERTPLLSSASFGHGGMGGQAGFADPDARVGFAYVTNHLVHENDTRSATLVGELRTLLG
jgi:CubicO group peptidase (beta-lactamase class C family)